MLSPRRTKPDPVIVMYELRTVRALKPLPTMRVIESRIKKWRGLLRWTMQAFASPRGEAVVQIIGERQSQVSRRDNLFSSWQRLVKLVGGVDCGRAAWATAANGSSFFADARVLHESYETAVAKVTEEAARVDAGTMSCTDMLPLLPPPVGAVAVASIAGPAAASSAASTEKASAHVQSPARALTAARTSIPTQPAPAADASTKTVFLSYQAFSGLVEPPPKNSR